MKFIHTGDIHYGMHPDSDKPWSNEQAESERSSLSVIVQAAGEKQVDLLLIAGDLFHSQPLAKDLQEVNYLFSSIPSVHVVIVAGESDYIRDNSAVLNYTWAPNVSYIISDSISSIYLSEINTEVHGLSYHNPEISEPLLSGIRIPDEGHISVLLAHGSDDNHLPIDINELDKAGFSYCALSHAAMHEVLIHNRIAMCGSPEPLSPEDSGTHGYMYGEIDYISRQVTMLKFVPYSTSKCLSLVVRVTPDSTSEELVKSLSNEISRRGSSNTYKFRIKGMRNPDIEFNFDALTQNLNVAEIIDESEPKYDLPKLFADHPSDMIGFFVKQMNKPKLSPIERKALYYGLQALLHETNEGGHS